MRWDVIFLNLAVMPKLKKIGRARGSAHNTKLGCVVLIDNKNFQANNRKIFTIFTTKS